MRKRFFLALCAALLLSGCSMIRQQEPVDTHPGMVHVASGQGTMMWVKEYTDVPVNPLRDIGIVGSREITDENGVRYEVRLGIDVSEHQGSIDWSKAASAGVQFAMLRAGYRGYGDEGKLAEDPCFADNLKGTAEAGIDIGVYFFSQATSTAEAEEEADFLIELLRRESPGNLTLPVFFDWEHISFDAARTDDVTDETVTDCAVAFCERLRAAGYEGGVYTYRFFAYHNYDLSRIKDYPLWIGAIGKNPDFYYAFDIWQRSTRGRFDGIEGLVDVDMIFVPVEQAPTETEGAEQ